MTKPVDRLQLILDKAHEIALKEVQSPREPGFAKIKAAAIEMAQWADSTNAIDLEQFLKPFKEYEAQCARYRSLLIKTVSRLLEIPIHVDETGAEAIRSHAVEEIRSALNDETQAEDVK